jgi:TonB family protein
MYAWRFSRPLLGLMMSFASLIPIADSQQLQSKDQPSQQSVGMQAVDLILNRYQVDKDNAVPKTHKPLSMDGKWSVGNGAPEICPKPAGACIRVQYRVSTVDVACEWTVLLQGSDDKNAVLDFNDDAARYLIAKPDSIRPKKLSGDAPVYPPFARTVHTQGTVKMRVHIDATGKVDKVSVVSGPETLQEAAVNAMKTWTYEPLLVGSDAVPLQSLVAINFALGGKQR